MYRIVEALCCTPETNLTMLIILNVLRIVAQGVGVRARCRIQICF